MNTLEKIMPFPELGIDPSIYPSQSNDYGYNVSTPKPTKFETILQAATGVANTVGTIVNTVSNIVKPANLVSTPVPTYQTPPIVPTNTPVVTNTPTQNFSTTSNVDKKDNTMLYVGGGIVLAIAAAYALKKKKYVKAKV